MLHRLLGDDTADRVRLALLFAARGRTIVRVVLVVAIVCGGGGGGGRCGQMGSPNNQGEEKSGG